MSLPDEAVEAAAEVLYDANDYFEGFADAPDHRRERFLSLAREALNAAVPHIRPAITSPTTLDRLPDSTVIRDANGDSWRQIDYPNKGTYWENLDNNDMYEQRSSAIPLPAEVISP